MSRALPDKVRAGDTLSAKWLNSLVDYLKYLNDMQLRRRLLKGVGYAVSESPGGSSLTIDRQAVVRVLSDDLDILRNEEFQVRIKPKGLCKVNPDTGDWDKVVQVHTGRITNHRDFTLPVIAKEGTESSSAPSTPTPESGTAWDATSWVDIGTLDDLGQGNKESPVALNSDDEQKKNEVAVYVKMTMEGGIPVAAVFTSDIKPDESDKAAIYIPIGTIHGESVEGTPRYYITQYQQGPIELGGNAAAMPFDVTVGVMQEENQPDGEGEEEPELKPCLNIAGGRVFLPEREFAVIPDKNEWPLGDSTEQEQYVVLTLSRNADGKLVYKYELAALSSLGTEVQTSEEKEETP